MRFGVSQTGKIVNLFFPELLEVRPFFVTLALVDGFIPSGFCLACLVAKLDVELLQCLVHDLLISEWSLWQSQIILAILEAHVMLLDWLPLIKWCIEFLFNCQHVLSAMSWLGASFL